jgi:hypothetical protein
MFYAYKSKEVATKEAAPPTTPAAITMSSADLSNEARVFRCLIGNYVAERLWQNGTLNLPLGLTIDEAQVLPRDLDLQGAFGRAVDAFIEVNDSVLDALVLELPQTKTDIEQCITDTCRSGLTYDSVVWGRVVAVAAFCAKVTASQCAQHGPTEHVVQLVDYVAEELDTTLSRIIREKGGWSVFALAFSKKPTKESGWLARLGDVIVGEFERLKL